MKAYGESHLGGLLCDNHVYLQVILMRLSVIKQNVNKLSCQCSLWIKTLWKDRCTVVHFLREELS